MGAGSQDMNIKQRASSRRERIEMLAKAVQSGDPIATHSLVEEIFAINGEIPETTTKTLKDRTLRAELKFHNKQHRLISAEQIADGINHLVNTVGAPDYTATSAAQIKQLRGQLLLQFPNLLAPIQHGQQMAEGKFSPAQSIFLEMVMMRQKMFNPDYQVPPTQSLPPIFHRTAEEQRRAAEKLKNNPKTAEIKKTIGDHSTLALDGGERLGHEVLDRCGLDR